MSGFASGGDPLSNLMAKSDHQKIRDYVMTTNAQLWQDATLPGDER